MCSHLLNKSSKYIFFVECWYARLFYITILAFRLTKDFNKVKTYLKVLSDAFKVGSYQTSMMKRFFIK